MKKPSQDLHHKFLDGIRIFNKYIFNRITLIFAGTGKDPFSVIRHIGRHSGRIYRTPVLASYVDETILIPLSYGEKVDWLRNVLAKGGCEILRQNKWMSTVNPVVIDTETAFTLLPEKRRKLFERFKLEKFLRLQVMTNGSIGD
jgi:deazaflavin-dependent oxidoreductase (nitroreductase family)